MLDRKKILIILVIAFIIILSLALFFLDSNRQTTNSVKTNYVGYNTLLDKINKVASSDPKIPQDPNFQKMIIKIKIVEDPKATKKDSLQSLKLSIGYATETYADLHDHNAYELQSDINDFIVANFPEQKNNGFKPLCFDPECGSAMDPAIKNVISEIQNSQVPDFQKQNDIDNLTNFSYLTNATSQSKVRDFLIAASIIKNDPSYTNLGINEKIYEEIINYLKNAYPQEYKDSVSLSPTPVAK